MSPLVVYPEKNKREGLSYAVTDDGFEVPVIDVTHPAFALAPTESELEARVAKWMAEEARRERMPRLLTRYILPWLLGRSVLGRSLQKAKGTYLAGTPTYLMKLGPENLGSYAGRLDRQIADVLPLFSLRLRLQDMARMLAEGLTPALQREPSRPLHFVNLAGGPCPDTLNALVVLRKQDASLLEGRRILLRVLDLDTAGPGFACRSLASLMATGGALHGLDIGFLHQRYDWSGPDALSALLAETGAAGEPLVALSSEGGLLEYGSDELIVANLRALHAITPSDTSFTASATREDELTQIMRRTSPVRTHARSLDSIRALAEPLGWRLDAFREAPFSRNVRLVKTSA